MSGNLRTIALGLLLALASPLAAFAQCSGQAPASTYCGNPTGALALPGWKSFSGIPFPTIAGGTVVGNRGTSSATASAITNPVLGIPGTSTGQIGLAGATSGTVTILPQAAAGTYNFNLPTSAGTSGQPLLSGGGGAAAQTYGTVVAIFGGTGFTGYALGDLLYADTTTTLAKLAGNITTGKQYLSQTGNGSVSAAPAWATIAGSDITGAALTKVDDTNVTATLGGSASTSLLRAASITLGWTGQLSLARGGTGASTQPNAAIAILPTPTRAGDVLYWNGTAWTTLAGNNSGTQVLSENASGVPSWTAAGTGTVTSITCAASLTCAASNPITASGTISLNVGNANSWTAAQTFDTSIAKIKGSSTGVTSLASANSGASNFTQTLQALTGTVTLTIASGAKALATSAISSAACTAAQTDTATGTLTTDAIIATFNADPVAVTGYVPLTTGMLTIIAYPTADTVNFKVCNNTASSITPGAITINWRVVR